MMNDCFGPITASNERQNTTQRCLLQRAMEKAVKCISDVWTPSLRLLPERRAIGLLIVLFQQKGEIAASKVAIQARLVRLNRDAFF